MTHKIILAPIRGITDQIYRNALHKHFGGIDEAVAPFIATRQDFKVKEREISELDLCSNKMKVIPQILTKHSSEYLDISNRLAQMGHKKINLNLGCPYPMVATKKKGSGMLPHPEMVDQLIGEILSKSEVKLSIKLRLGYESRDEIFNIIPILNKYKIMDITIHPRIGKQLYTGKVDLDSFSECLEKLHVTPTYNGDINSLEELTALQERFTDVKSWMIGRGILMNPDFLGRKSSNLFDFHDSLAEGYLNIPNGKSNFLVRMKAHWEYLSESLSNSPKIRKKIKKAKSIEHYNDVISRLKDEFNE